MTIQFAKAKGRFRTIITDGIDPDETPDIVLLSGTVTLTPNVPYLIDESDPDGDFYGSSPFIAEVRDGILSTPGQPVGYLWVVATDSPDINPVDWKYNVTFNLKTPDGRQIVIPAITVVAPTGEELNLSRLIPAANSPAIGTAVAEAAALRAEAALAASVRSVNDTLPDDAGNVDVVASAPPTGWSASTLSDSVQQLLTKANTSLQQSDLTTINTAISGKADAAATTTALAGKAATSHTHTASQITDGSATWTIVTRAISAGTGLTGGGSFAADRSIALNAASIASLAKADTAVQPATLTSGLAAKADASAVATSLAAKADLVGGVIATSQLPALAINDIFPVTSQAQMLALTAQRGDMAIRSDTSTTWVLATDDPTTLANWKVLPTPSGSAITSINGQTSGAIVLGKADIGLGNVDNTSDLNKPVSTATTTALGLKVDISAFGNTTVLSKNSSGVLAGLTYATAATASAIPLRGTSGQLTVPTTPTNASDATSKSYTDTQDALKAPLASPAFTGTPTGITATHVGAIAAPGTPKIMTSITSAAYAALATKDATTVYLIVG